LIIINAKAHIGFDLKRNYKLHADNDFKKKIILTNFSAAEIFQFLQNFSFTTYKTTFQFRLRQQILTSLNYGGKKHIMDKFPKADYWIRPIKRPWEAVLFNRKNLWKPLVGNWTIRAFRNEQS